MEPYTAYDAAKILGMDHSSVCRRARKARLRGRPIGYQIGTMWLFTPADVQRLAGVDARLGPRRKRRR